MADALVVGIAVGRSPDIVAVVEEARRQGALTVALTNAADSPLAETADHVVDLRAGPERATAATKTYTTELLAAALLSTALDPPSPGETADLAGLPALISVALTAEPTARDLAAAHAKRACRRARPRLRYASARGGAQAAGMALVAAMPYSAADFGTDRWPWLNPACRCGGGPERPGWSPGRPLARLKEDHGAPAGDLRCAAARGSTRSWPCRRHPPAGADRRDRPPSHAYHLTVARGLNPEHPRSIRKVTETR
jgi:glucosamine--fructose-6-phosphate aminotransferase (isomerizing)